MMSTQKILITVTAWISLLFTLPFASAQDDNSESPLSPKILELYGEVDLPAGYWQEQSDAQLREWLRVAESELERCKKNGAALGKSLAALDSVSGVPGSTILELRNLQKKITKCYLKNAAIVAAIKKEINRRISVIIKTPKKEGKPKKADVDRDKRIQELQEQKKLLADHEKDLKAAQTALKDNKSKIEKLERKNK